MNDYWEEMEKMEEERDAQEYAEAQAYKNGRNDAIDEFKERLLNLCSGGEECIDCVGGNCTGCLENSVDYSSIVDLAEELKEKK